MWGHGPYERVQTHISLEQDFNRLVTLVRYAYSAESPRLLLGWDA
jgi:hypothetical protein